MRNQSGFQFYPGKRLPVVCRDGITRQAVATGYSDFGLPAAVQVTVAGKRRTVSGVVFRDEVPCGFVFLANGINRGLIPWTAYKPQLAAVALRLYKSTAGRKWRFYSDQAAALAEACRDWQSARFSSPGLGWIASRELNRIKPELLPRLVRFFDKHSALLSTPPPPPPA
jgi:hypothetical protein